jgi:DNA-binding FadR family transcriptional regulator
MEKMEAAKDNYLEFAKLDLEFHETLCTLPGHYWLHKQWSSMKTYIWLFIRASQLLDAPGNEQVICLHYDIVEAIRAGLPKAAELVARRHSEIIGEEIRLAWQREGWQGSKLFHPDDK